ncbi:MAG: MFS transporter [Sphaerobacter thermophilus]|uniref:MFS transporter n=1 Tax=Sphaerobacter thermophilus TaxID=2057 RepID=UPI00396F06CD
MDARDSEAAAADNRRGWRWFALLGLVFLVGVTLRTVLLGVPPVLPLIQRDLGLSYTATGLLTGLPMLMMGGAAWASGRAIERIGGRRAVTIGLVLLAVGALLRAPFSSVAFLYIFTAVLSLGIALAQTAVPVLVRSWFPRHIGLAAALYTDGIIAGEVLAVAATGPVLLGWLGEDAWRASFVAWGLTVIPVILLWHVLAPAAEPASPRLPRRVDKPQPVAPQPDAAGRPRVRAWHLGLVSSGGAVIYFTMNSWIPPYNDALGHGDATALALTVLNAAQLPVSIALTFVAQRLAGERWPFITVGVVGISAIIGMTTTPLSWQPIWVGILGSSSVAVLVLGTALPPLLAGPGEVARLTGATLTINYGVAFVGPLFGGWLWDQFDQPALAFAPVVLAGLILIVLGARLPRRAKVPEPVRARP